jgi:hypothetical protein
VTRNIVEDPEGNRELEGRYTFNAFPPEGYEGFVLVVAALRLGDHAHLEVSTGRTAPRHSALESVEAWRVRLRYALAGRLIMRWEEWLIVRAALDGVPWARIAEVERPSKGQLEHHLP